MILSCLKNVVVIAWRTGRLENSVDVLCLFHDGLAQVLLDGLGGEPEIAFLGDALDILLRTGDDGRLLGIGGGGGLGGFAFLGSGFALRGISRGTR